jgi:tripartite-type tricarboxylate transporter receptor subunit TctC
LQTQTFITHIPYRGTGPALQDLISGNVDMMFDGLGSSAQHIRAGRVKPILVAGQQRNPSFPDIPCAGELGMKEYNVSTWYGMWVPKGTPANIQAEFTEVIRKSRDMAEIKTAWATNGAEFPNLTGAAFGDFIAAETKRWAAVVKASGAKLD